MVGDWPGAPQPAMVLLWTNDSLMTRSSSRRQRGELEQGFDSGECAPLDSGGHAVRRVGPRPGTLPCSRREGGGDNTGGISGSAAGPSAVTFEANAGSWLRGGSRAVLDSLGGADPPRAFSKVEVSLNISGPWQAGCSGPEAKARVEAVVVGPSLSVMLLPNLIKGTLIHVRAKVMNERSAGAVEEYSRTVGRWGSLVGGQPGG
jgi:hypothetical protein